MVQKKKKRNIQYLYVLDEGTKFLIKGNGKTDVIVSEKKFNTLLLNELFIENVIILVELKWKGHLRQEFYGYELAKLLMNSITPGSSFNLLFISILTRETLFKLNTSKNRIFVQKFPHSSIFDLNFSNIKIPRISKRKFDYLKNYCLLETGILDRLEHDVRNLINSYDSDKLSKLVKDIKANSDILNCSIISKAEKLLCTKKDDKKKEILYGILKELLNIISQINNKSSNWKIKSSSRVLLIEDNQQALKKLKKQLSGYFNSVNALFSGTKAVEELRKKKDKNSPSNALNYDVVITDMELLDGNFDDAIQGIDILEICEKEFPFLTTRIITGLPKYALKKLTGKNYDEIIFKSSSTNSVISPIENITELVQKIDKEVELRKKLRSMPGPKLSWWGKYLTKELYCKKIFKNEEFLSYWKNAKSKANSFIEGEFNSYIENEKLSIEFKAVSAVSKNPESGWGIIELLLTHRLIALWYGLIKFNGSQFYWNGEGEDVYVKQKGFKSGLEERAAKAYFNTFLGLSGENLPNSKDANQRCKLLLQDLFPEEIEWLTSKNSSLFNKTLLMDMNLDLLNFVQVFGEIYNNTELNDETTTYNNAIKFLRNFINNYPGETYNKEKHEKLKECFNAYYNDIYNAFSISDQSLINEIKDILS